MPEIVEMEASIFIFKFSTRDNSPRRLILLIIIFNSLTPHIDHPFLTLVWHVLVGYLLTVSCDWNWIPLTKEEKKRGPSLDQIRGKIFS